METLSCFFVVFLVNVHLFEKFEVKGYIIKEESKSGNAKHEYSHHEVTTPTFSHQRARRSFPLKTHAEEVSVVLNAFNKDLVLDLKKNRNLFTKSFVEKHYSEDGDPVIKTANLENGYHHCYYHGNIRGIPDSIVAVSTCDGLRGIIHSQDDQYYIEPSNSSVTEHLIYKNEHHMGQNISFDHSEESFYVSSHTRNILKETYHRVRRDVTGPWNQNIRTRFVELYLVNDFRQYDDMDRNLDKTVQRAIEATNIANALYNQLDIYLALVGVETWTAGDRITVENDADKTLNSFLTYRKQFINPVHRNDNAQLITGHVFRNGVVGKAMKGVICTHKYSCAVNMDHSTAVNVVATTLAHELGHSFGMEHDQAMCSCPDSRCIMAGTSGAKQPTKWSSCSRQYLEDAFKLGMDYCLHNKPDMLYKHIGGMCGNGLMEEGEECDCGLPQYCTNKCCNATSCTLTLNATCATGSCCDFKSCQPKQISSVCRPSSGECDLPEFCDGESELCPSDHYRQDGSHCSGGKSHCYEGQCNTRAERCQLLWGPTGRVSSRTCFEINAEGTANGNCGYDWLKDIFYKCNEDDVMCGMLHCIHTNEKLMFWKDSLVKTLPRFFPYDSNGESVVCRAAILDVGLDMVDPGMVPDGNSCGNNKMCVNHKCRSISSLDIPKCKNNCSNHGVCNNKGSCHCDIGYAPPYCDSEGAGGSTSSGPASETKGLGAVTVAMLIIFLCVVPLLGLTVFCSWYNREKIKKYWVDRTQGKKYSEAPRGTASTQGVLVPKATPHIKATRPAPCPPHRSESFRDKEISTPVLTSTTNETSPTKLQQVIPYSVIRKAPPLPNGPPPMTNAACGKRVPPPRPKSIAAATASQFSQHGSSVRKSSSFSTADQKGDDMYEPPPPRPPNKPSYVNVKAFKKCETAISDSASSSKPVPSAPMAKVATVSHDVKKHKPSPPRKRYQSKAPSLEAIPQGSVQSYDQSSCNGSTLLDDVYAEIGETSNVYDDIDSKAGFENKQLSDKGSGNYDNMEGAQTQSNVAALAARFANSQQSSLSKSQSFAGQKPQKPIKPRNINRDSVC